MRIISKQALGFRNQDDNSIVVVKPLEICTVPDWVKNDSMYIWGKTAGIINDIEQPTQVAVSKGRGGKDKGKDATVEDSTETTETEKTEA